MLNWLVRRNRSKRIGRFLYDRIVAQSRLPIFYAELGVPDTLAGRFELLALHVFAVLERLRLEGPAAEPVAQHLVDTFCADMDTTMRELGVGDLSVSKHVRAAAGALYGRLGDYRASVAEENGAALAAAIRRHVFADGARDAQDAQDAQDARDARDAQLEAAILAGYVLATLRTAAPPPGLAEGGALIFADIDGPAAGAGGRHGEAGA